MPIALLLDPVTAPGRPRTATFSSSATGLAPIGDAGTAVVSSYVFQIMTTAAAFSLNIKKKLRGSSETFANAGATWYEDMNAGPDTVSGGTAISAAGTYKVYADGCELALNMLTNNGTVVVEMIPLLG
jgi:hypothetical protein